MPLQTQLCMHGVSLDHVSLLIFAPVSAHLMLPSPRPVFVLNPVCRTKIFRSEQGSYWCQRALNLLWGKKYQQPMHVCMSSIFLCFDLDLIAEDVAVHCLNLNPTLHHLLLSKSTIQYTICQDVSEISNDQDKE
jgi:hypothetical protein